MITESGAARLAAEVMGSRRAQFFDDHVLVKEPHTGKPTPWHQDAPCYFVDGAHTVGFWLPLDPVSGNETLRLVAASHRWPQLVLPVKWLDDADFYDTGHGQYMTLPDLDDPASKASILEWEMQPGDALLFHFRTVHGARGNRQARRAEVARGLVPGTVAAGCGRQRLATFAPGLTTAASFPRTASPRKTFAGRQRWLKIGSIFHLPSRYTP